MFHLDTRKIIGKEIGRGSFGTVYAYSGKNDPKGQHNSVVKCIRAHSIKTLFKAFQEVVLGFSCDHPSIISTSGYCIKQRSSEYPSEHEGEQLNEFNIYIRMPRMKQNLLDFIQESGKNRRLLSLEEIVKKLHALASGIEYLHKRKIVHRDVKPNNILMDNNENVLLSDIGSAVFVPEDEHSIPMTYAEGNEKYMAPEIYDKHGKPERKMYIKGDVWSLGLCIAQLCLMDLEISLRNREEKVKGMIERIREIYKEPLASIIEGMLKSNPEERTFITDVRKKLEKEFPNILGIINPENEEKIRKSERKKSSLDLIKEEEEEKERGIVDEKPRTNSNDFTYNIKSISSNLHKEGFEEIRMDPGDLICPYSDSSESPKESLKFQAGLASKLKGNESPKETLQSQIVSKKSENVKSQMPQLQPEKQWNKIIEGLQADYKRIFNVQSDKYKQLSLKYASKTQSVPLEQFDSLLSKILKLSEENHKKNLEAFSVSLDQCDLITGETLEKITNSICDNIKVEDSLSFEFFQ